MEFTVLRLSAVRYSAGALLPTTVLLAKRLIRTCCVSLRFLKSRLSTAEFRRVRCSRWCWAAASDGWVREDPGSDQSSPPDTRSSYSCSANI